MPVAHLYDPFDVAGRLRRRSLRKLSAELARLERAARAARTERERLERDRAAALARRGSREAKGGATSTGRSARTEHMIAAARRREEALQLAIGDCRAQIFGKLLRGKGENAYH